MKFLIVAHGHPDINKGGGELAAYHHFKGLLDNGLDAYFLAKAPVDYLFSGTLIISSYRFREYLYYSDFNANFFSNSSFIKEFRRLLDYIKPNIIHFHHYIFIGVDAIYAVKRILPDAKIILTLHEFLAICLRDGQMVKTNGDFCYRASPYDCRKCFPNITMEDFFLREKYIKRMFREVDLFISPSNFLKERYVMWGIPDAKIQVLENGIPREEKLSPRKIDNEKRRKLNFSYFGQFTPYKGVDLIIKAFSLLPSRIKEKVLLNLHGTYHPDENYTKNLKDLIDKNKDIVIYHGPYENEELPKLMANTDWVVLGSIWWENSPLVIQEAFKYGRPVICPDIGGMAEKVKHGYGGLNYRARDPYSLRDLIIDIAQGKYSYDEILSKMPKYKPIDEFIEDYLELVKNLFRG